MTRTPTAVRALLALAGLAASVVVGLWGAFAWIVTASTGVPSSDQLQAFGLAIGAGALGSGVALAYLVRIARARRVV